MTENLPNYLQIQNQAKQIYDLFYCKNPHKDINRTEAMLLRIVGEQEAHGKKIISTQIADCLHITRSAVSQTVDRLEERGYIVRRAAENDKKIAYIELSEEERERQRPDIEAMSEKFDRVKAKMGEKEMEQLAQLMERFIAYADELASI